MEVMFAGNHKNSADIKMKRDPNFRVALRYVVMIEFQTKSLVSIRAPLQTYGSRRCRDRIRDTC